MIPINNGSGGDGHPAEKWIRRIVPFVLIGLGIYFSGTIMAFLAELAKNAFKFIGFGVLTFFLSFTFIKNYRTICKWIATFFLNLDPLTPMDNYADLLVGKLKNLRKGTVGMKAELAETDKQIEDDTTTMEQNLKLAAAADQLGKSSEKVFYATEAKNAEQSIKTAMPGKQQLEANIQFMMELADNWEISIKGIRSFNARMRRDYKRLKKQAKALRQSEDFLKGETPASRQYFASIQIANQHMAQWKAEVEDFEQRAKPILERGRIENTVRANEGLSLLDDYMKSGKLKLPDFSKIEAESIPFEQISTGGIPKKEFNLLKK